MLWVSLAKQDGKSNDQRSRSRRCFLGSPLEGTYPLAQAVHCQPRRGWINGKHLNQVEPSPLAARQASPRRAKGRVSTSRGTRDGHPQHGFHRSPPTGKGSTLEQNRRSVCKSQETRFELCQVSRIVSKDRERSTNQEGCGTGRVHTHCQVQSWGRDPGGGHG